MSTSEFNAKIKKINDKQAKIVRLQIECEELVEDAIGDIRKRIGDLGYAEGINRNEMSFSTRKVNGGYLDCIEGYEARCEAANFIDAVNKIERLIVGESDYVKIIDDEDDERLIEIGSCQGEGWYDVFSFPAWVMDDDIGTAKSKISEMFAAAGEEDSREMAAAAEREETRARAQYEKLKARFGD